MPPDKRQPPHSFLRRVLDALESLASDLGIIAAFLWPVILLPLLMLSPVILFFVICKPY